MRPRSPASAALAARGKCFPTAPEGGGHLAACVLTRSVAIATATARSLVPGALAIWLATLGLVTGHFCHGLLALSLPTARSGYNERLPISA